MKEYYVVLNVRYNLL